jgi:hypothetical protein
VPTPSVPQSIPHLSEPPVNGVAESERPYSINELAVLHNLDRRTVIRLYENEPDVLVLQASREHQQALGRRYRTIRVPRHVYRRVLHRMENR